MKKILTLFSALLLTVSMWGAYTITTVENFTAVPKGDKLLLTFNAVESSSNHYYYDICFEITPSVDGFVGTFSKAAGTLSTTNTRLNWIYNQSATNPGKLRTGRTLYSGSSQSITIAKVGEDSYTMSGTLNARAATESSDKVYNFTNIPFSVYSSEPAQEASAIDLSGKTLSMTSYEDETPMTFTIANGYYNTLYLQLNVAEYTQPAANTTFNVAASGNNTIQLSFGQTFVTGSSSVTHFVSYYEDYSGWDPYYYFIIGGSLTVTYSQDNKTMTLAGTLTTAHGTEFIVNSTMNNPWYVPEPETIELTVSKVDVSKGPGYFDLALTATPNNFMIDLAVDALAGADINDVDPSYTYVDLGSYTTSKMDATATAVNALSIVATGNTDEYKLDATIVCKDKNTYVMKDVIFTYETPNAWTEEPKGIADFTFTSTSGSEEFLSNKGYMLFTFNANSWDKVEIALKASAEAAPAAATYNVVNDSPANGDIVGSAGKVGYTYNPSMVTLYGTGGYQRFFVRGGSVKVGYSQDNTTLTMTGDVTTYRGTTITLNLAMENPFLPKEKTLDITSIDATITTTGMDFDIVTASKFDPSEVMLSLIGTAKNPLAIVGSYNYSNFESWYSYADTKDGYYEFKTGSTIEITNGEGGCVMNGTLLCQNGWTYFIEDAPITYSMAVSELADQTALLNRAINATIDLTVQRSFVDGMWQTICLPFDIADIDESPLAGATVKSVTSCTLDGETLLVYAEDVTSMTAGMPYLIMWESGAPTNPVFENVTIKTTEGTTSGSFVANLNAKHIDDVTGKYMVVAENGLASMTDEGTMKGFRAYFQLDVPAGIAPRKFAFAKNEATGTETPAAEMQDAKVLVKGQLMLLSGDKVYNVQAQELK